MPYSEDMNERAPRVLIVDDMPVNRTILASLLSAQGVRSDMAEGGKECLAMYEMNDYDLILLDHRMPEYDGVDTLVRLKEMFRKEGREIPVVCHTTEAGRDNINLYKAAGFADVLIKPIIPSELYDVLMKYLPGGREELTKEDEEKKQHTDDELSVLPHWLKTVPKLDLIDGIKHCDTAEDYVDALAVFAASIPAKSAEIEKYAKDGNWAMYTLRVHSLKSVARLVGAKQLAEHAADLEYAGKHEQYEKLKRETGSLLNEYREFTGQLSRLSSSDISKEMNKKSARVKKEDTRRILFVGDEKSIVGKGMIKHLETTGFKVISVPENEDEIFDHRIEADIVLYYPQGNKEHIRNISAFLSDMCRDDRKIYCLAGDIPDVKEACRIPLSNEISAVYERPIDLEHLSRDMKRFSELQHEYNRKKSILIIDDDVDFLTIMERWLKNDYKVDCARSGKDALFFLGNVRPDLILLDYEMPELDGFEVMQLIRNNPHTHRIPIIFLTGKNDRGNVMKILEQKPDGYLLKSMPKDELLDSLERFFSESILRGRG